MKLKAHLLPFLGAVVLEIIAITSQSYALGLIAKPLLIPALIYYFYKSVPATNLNPIIIRSLVFSFLGDTLLMFSAEQEIFFIAGLVCFLIAHVIYIVVYLNAVDTTDRGFKFQWQDLIFVVYGLTVFSVLKPNLGDLYIPTLLYTIVICMMAITARKRWKKSDTASFWLVMFGAISFMFSDTLLAYNKFVAIIPNPGLLIMGTYLLGQFLIVEGLIVFIKKVRPEEV